MPAPRRAPVLAAVLAVALSACSGGGRDDQAAKTTAGKGDVTAKGIDTNPVSRDQLPDGGTLRWPLIATPPNFNAGELDGTSADVANIVGALLPSLFGFDAEARPTPNR